MEEPKVKPQHKLVAKYFLGAAAGNAERAVLMAGYSKKYAPGSAKLHGVSAERSNE